MSGLVTNSIPSAFYNQDTAKKTQSRSLSFVFDSVLGPLRLAVIEARFKAPFQPKQPFKGAQLRQIKLLEGLKESFLGSKGLCMAL